MGGVTFQQQQIIGPTESTEYDSEHFTHETESDRVCYYRLLSAEHKNRDVPDVVRDASTTYREQVTRLVKCSVEPLALLYHEAHFYVLLQCDIASTSTESLFDGLPHIASRVLPQTHNLYTAAADDIVVVAFYCTPRQLMKLPAKPPSKQAIIGKFKLLPKGKKTVRGYDLLPTHFNLLYHWGLCTDAEWNVTLQELQYLSNVQEDCLISNGHILETESDEEEEEAEVRDDSSDSEMVDGSLGQPRTQNPLSPSAEHSSSTTSDSSISSTVQASAVSVENFKIRMSGPSKGILHFTKPAVIAEMRAHLPESPLLPVSMSYQSDVLNLHATNLW